MSNRTTSTLEGNRKTANAVLADLPAQEEVKGGVTFLGLAGAAAVGAAAGAVVGGAVVAGYLWGRSDAEKECEEKGVKAGPNGEGCTRPTWPL